MADCGADVMSKAEKIISGILWFTAIGLIISQLFGCSKTYLEPVEQLPIEEMFQPKSLELSKVKQIDSFTNWNKFWLSTAVAGQVADTLTTFDKLDEGYIEVNPLFGTDPDRGFFIASKIAATAFVIWIAEYYFKDDPRQQEYRNWLYGTFGVIGGSFALWNSQQ